MNSAKWIGAWIVSAVVISSASAGPLNPHINLKKVNACLKGQLIDYTHNHHADNRIWSEALCEKRDLYVYLPPGFDPNQQYPLVIHLHAITQDEQSFPEHVVKLFDEAIACGDLPPMIVAAPDGSLQGRPSFLNSGSFYINTPKGGKFEDFIMQDVWNFLFANFPIRPEREAHALLGASMGGFGAFNLGIKYRDRIKIVAGVFPAINLRYVDCHCKYRSPFDPCCFGWRQQLPPCEVMARFYCVLAVRLHQIIWPLYGCGHEEQTLAEISAQNPAEMLESYDVKPGDLDMFMAYGGKDEFNIAAQVESFVYLANQRGIEVGTAYLPNGRHDVATGIRLFPAAARWICPRLAPYAPGFVGPPPAAPAVPEDKLPAPKKNEADPQEVETSLPPSIETGTPLNRDPQGSPASEESDVPAIPADIGRAK